MSTRYYYSLGSEIYGGVAGLYDWGPPGKYLIFLNFRMRYSKKCLKFMERSLYFRGRYA